MARWSANKAAAGLRLLLAAGAVGWPSQSLAKVEMGFYARDGDGRGFPHAFVTLKGTVDSTGERVDSALGFTSVRVSPAMLAGSVPGRLLPEPPRLVARSNRLFAVTLSDRRYRAVQDVVRRWREARQPSYNLHRRNCVHFVGELARASGLRVPRANHLMKEPRKFLLSVKAANPLLGSAPPGLR